MQHCPLPRHCGQLETTYFEKVDASVTGGRCEVLVVVKMNVTQAPGMCKLLAVPIKNPRTAQVPAWQGEKGRGGPGESGVPTAQTPSSRDLGTQTPAGFPASRGLQFGGRSSYSWTNYSA